MKKKEILTDVCMPVQGDKQMAISICSKEKWTLKTMTTKFYLTLSTLGGEYVELSALAFTSIEF